MKVVIIKYNAGNIFSVESALNRLGIKPIITDDERLIKSADRVIFPGVGEASSTMKYLREKGLDKTIRELTKPILGICLGMQLMCKHSEEGNTDCLNIFDAEVKKFIPNSKERKVPHMGWNTIFDLKSSLFDNMSDGEYVYFVHSYFVELSLDTIASTDYIQPFSAALNKNNFYATQFHPEKSGDAGEQILRNFLFKV